MACANGDVARAYEITDAIHCIPENLLRGTVTTDFREAYLQPLYAKYPDLVQLDECLVSDGGRQDR
jgi:hypothetical protein